MNINEFAKDFLLIIGGGGNLECRFEFCDSLNFQYQKLKNEVDASIRINSGFWILEQLYKGNEEGWKIEKREGAVWVVEKGLKQVCLADENIAAVVNKEISSIRDRLELIQRSDYSRCYIYGGGTHTVVCWDLFNEFLGDIDGVVDRNPERAIFKEVECIALGDFKPMSGDLIVLSSHLHETEMKYDLEDQFGTGLNIVSLYGRDSWEEFLSEKETSLLDNGIVCDCYDNWLMQIGRERSIAVNAIGFGNTLHEYLRDEENSLPLSSFSLMEDSTVTSLSKEVVCRSWRENWDRIKGRVSGYKKVAWVDYYAFGTYLEYPVADFVSRLLDSNTVDCIVVIVTEDCTLDFLNSMKRSDDRLLILPLLLSDWVSCFLPFDDGCRKLWAETDQEFSDSPSKIFDAYRVMREKLRLRTKKTILYKEFIEELVEECCPSLFVNLQDNRSFSRAYRYSNTSNIPSVQLQHGILSSWLSPFYCDVYLGWKDPHSTGAFRGLSRGSIDFYPYGDFCTNQLARRSEGLEEIDETDVLTMTFFAQGPPFWTVAHELVHHALTMIDIALSRFPRRWKLNVKFDQNDGKSVYLNCWDKFNSNYEVNFLPHSTDNLNLLSESDVIVSISSSFLLVAGAFNRLVLSVESASVRGIARTSDYGMDIGVENVDEMIERITPLMAKGYERAALKVRNEDILVRDSDFSQVETILSELMEEK